LSDCHSNSAGGQATANDGCGGGYNEKDDANDNKITYKKVKLSL
jgi:hypothetical protein